MNVKHLYCMASGSCEDGNEAAGDTDGATGKAQIEVLYLLPVVCTPKKTTLLRNVLGSRFRGDSITFTASTKFHRDQHQCTWGQYIDTRAVCRM